MPLRDELIAEWRRMAQIARQRGDAVQAQRYENIVRQYAYAAGSTCS